MPRTAWSTSARSDFAFASDGFSGGRQRQLLNLI